MTDHKTQITGIIHVFSFVFRLHSHSDVDSTNKLLDLIEEQITLFNDLMVLCILFVRSASLHNITNFINLSIQSASRDETGQLSI